MCSLTQVSMAVITFGAHWGRDQQHLSERERDKIMWLSTVQQLLISHRLECDYWCGTCRRSDDQSIGWSKKKISINKWGSHDAWQTGDKHAYCRTPCEIWGEDQALLRMRRGSLVERIKARGVGWNQSSVLGEKDCSSRPELAPVCTLSGISKSSCIFCSFFVSTHTYIHM